MRQIHFKSIIAMLGFIALLSACKKESFVKVEPAPTVDSTKANDSTVVNPPVQPVDSNQNNPDTTVNNPAYKTYLIKKGNNYCDNNTYRIDSVTILRFKAILDSSCIYSTKDPNNQADINKLYGFSDSMSHHHTNSARFGWNWKDGEMHIHAYCYVQKQRIHKELGTVKIGEPFDCSIEMKPGKYIFTLNGKSTEMPRGNSGEKCIGYELLPYFGGDEPAPQDIRVQLLQY